MPFKRIALVGAIVASVGAAASVAAQDAQDRETDRLDQVISREPEDLASRDQAQEPSTVEQSVLWGLAEEAREHMVHARELLLGQPEQAADELMVASNHLQLQAAGARGDAKQDLEQAAVELSKLRQRVANRQIVHPDQLDQTLAQASLALAAHAQNQAQFGIETNNEAAAGYGLRFAARSLQQALAFERRQPNEQTSRAIFNAHRLGEQLIALIHPTTGQGGELAVTAREEASDFERSRALEEGRRDRADRTVAGEIPQIAPDVVHSLGEAIDDVRDQVR